MKRIAYLSIFLILAFNFYINAQPQTENLFYEDFDGQGIEEEFLVDSSFDGSYLEDLFPGAQIRKEIIKERLIDKLKLTPEQQKQFNELRNEHQKKMIDLRAQLQKNQLDIKNMLLQNKIDEKKLMDLVQSNNKLITEMRTSAINNWLAIYKILNDEQKELWTKHFNFGFGDCKKIILKHKMMDRKRMRSCY
ncbi:MAG: Spy/CpxP family protein refolding chaperone [Melioribacter sp.]|nr:Spy/CpxP family protein refolding chaperone [Melioribacter sp.]